MNAFRQLPSERDANWCFRLADLQDVTTQSLNLGPPGEYYLPNGRVAGFSGAFHTGYAGLTALLLAVPMAYTVLKTVGVLYFLYLAYNAVKPSRAGIFDVKPLPPHSPAQLFRMGFLTNVLNPKIALFYVSFSPVHPT